jgi:hypothetical protein
MGDWDTWEYCEGGDRLVPKYFDGGEGSVPVLGDSGDGFLMEPLTGLLRKGGNQKGLERGIILGGMAKVLYLA